VRLARAVLLLPVVGGVFAIAIGCGGHKRASTEPAARKAQPAYSVASVKKAFAAEGLPLILESRFRGIVTLSPKAWNLVADFTVTVWPPSRASRTFLVVIQSGYRTVRVRNVVVDYAPASLKAARVRSAMARLTVAPSPAQALRTCVDRWNQGSMLGWGPTLVSVSIRRLAAREQAQLGLRGRGLPRCTVSLAVHSPRDPRTGCSGYAVMPGHPKSCVSRQTTFVCVVNSVGGYECARYADGSPPLRNENATTDGRGVLTLDAPLTGTHGTPPLAWQRRYPHIDGFIDPWTRAGRLRRGLTFEHAGPSRHYRGACFHGSEFTFESSALRCVSDVQFDPCFGPRADWNRRGVVVACASPGWTTFGRFVISPRP
jgi:hypothetical protein